MPRIGDDSSGSGLQHTSGLLGVPVTGLSDIRSDFIGASSAGNRLRI